MGGGAVDGSAVVAWVVVGGALVGGGGVPVKIETIDLTKRF